MSWALSFDGVDDQVTATARANTANFSFSCRFYLDSNPSSYMPLYIDTLGGQGLMAFVDNNKIGCQYFSPGWASAGDEVTVSHVGAWHHFAVTYDGTLLKLYFDGTEVASSTPGVTPSTATSGNMVIGQAWGDFFTGLIRDVKKWTVALTPTQVADDAAGTVPTSGLVRHYAFDEGTGSTVANSGSDGSGANGTITGATWVEVGTTYSESISLSAEGADSYNRTSVFRSSFSLSASQAVSQPLNTLSLSDAATFTSAVSYLPSGGILVSGSINLNASGEIEASSIGLLSSTLNFNAQFDLEPNSTLSLSEAINIAIGCAIEAAGQDPSLIFPRKTIYLTGSKLVEREIKGSMTLTLSLSGT